MGDRNRERVGAAFGCISREVQGYDYVGWRTHLKVAKERRKKERRKDSSELHLSREDTHASGLR